MSTSSVSNSNTYTSFSPDQIIGGKHIRLIAQGEGFSDAAKDATLWMLQGNDAHRCAAKRIFEFLLEKGEEVDNVADCAQELLSSSDTETHKRGLVLLADLVHRGHCIDSALSFAAMAVLDSNWVVRKIALSLFESLFKLGRGFDEASDAREKMNKIGEKEYLIDAESLGELISTSKITLETEREDR